MVVCVLEALKRVGVSAREVFVERLGSVTKTKLALDEPHGRHSPVAFLSLRRYGKCFQVAGDS